MKILFIQKKTNTGGSKESLLCTMRLFIKAGHEVEVLCSSKGDLTEKLNRCNIAYHSAYIPEYRQLFDRLRFSYYVNRIRAKLPEDDHDWVISNEMWWGPVAAALAKKMGCRSGVVLRDTLKGPSKLKKYNLDRLDRVLCINPVMTQWVNGLYDKMDNGYTIFNPVVLGEIDQARLGQWRNKLAEWTNVNMKFLMVGSLCERKNQVDAVKTLSLLEEFFGDKAGLVLAGGGNEEYIAKIKVAAREHALSDKLMLTNHVTGVHELLKTVDCFLFTSLREGLPRSIIEALLAGLPAFSYPLPGLEALFGEYYNTFVADQPTPDALHDKIVSAFSDEERMGSEVIALREKLGTRFSEKKILRI